MTLRPTPLVAAGAVLVALLAGGDLRSAELAPDSVVASRTSAERLLQAMAAPALERAPYLQNVTPTSAVIRWRTSDPSSTRVRWGLAADALDHAVDLPGRRTEHEVPLTGLPPETEIFYSVGSKSRTLAGGDAEHAFGTPPLAGQRRPIRIWVTGDHGRCGDSTDGCIEAAAVRDGYTAWAGTRPADFWLMLGDNAYEFGNDTDYTNGHFNAYATIMRNTPFWSAPGNHEFASDDADSDTQSGAYYDSHTFPTAGEGGGVPSGTEAYYSFDWGNVHVVSLDSYDTGRSAPADPTRNVCPPGEGGAMYRWLCADLAANDKDFLVAIWHHPPYSKGSHDSDAQRPMIEMRRRFLPVLERYGVDVVMTGHSHSYERSVLLGGHYDSSESYSAALHARDAGAGDPDGDGAYRKRWIGPVPHAGSVQVVAGNASKVSGGDLDHPVMVTRLHSLGSVVIDVVGRQLDARLIGVGGVELDHFRILKGDPLPACSDGVDQDGDGKFDYPEDPGCVHVASWLEDPACNDDLDNDGDGRTDWDGGPASGDPDYACFAPWWVIEAPDGTCGLGAELPLVLVLLRVWRRRLLRSR
jgi:hypothetical protein